MSNIQLNTEKSWFFYSTRKQIHSERATPSQSMPQTHLPVLSEPLCSTLQKSHHHIDLASYLMAVDSSPSHVSNSHPHFVTYCRIQNTTNRSMPARASESGLLPQLRLQIFQLGSLGRWKSDAFQSYIHPSLKEYRYHFY